MITIKDVAQKCGVSNMTVSRALNNSDLVTESTRELVLKACEELGYIPNSAAKSLVTKETNMIGLVVPETDFYYATSIRSITLFLESQGYGTLLCNYDCNPKIEIKYMHYLLQGRVDGIILFAFNPQTQEYTHFVNKIPVVFVNKVPDKINASFVGSDNYFGSFKMMEHIISKGYRRIGAICGDLSHKTFYDRMRAYKDVLEKNNISFDPNIFCESELSFKQGLSHAKDFIDKKVDAIFAFNDICALGVLKYCSENSIAVPDSIGVAGYDNIESLEMFDLKLSTIDYNGPLAGEKAATILLEEINDRSLPKRNIILKPTLIEGKTIL